MNMIYLSQALDATLVVLLLISCVTDWRERIIPHWLNITIALLAPVGWWVHGLHLWPDIAMQIGLSIGIFAFFLIFQAIGAMGGGDVKLLGALALWLHWPVMFTLIFFMSLFGGVLTLVMLIYHNAKKFEHKLEIPYGIAIALAGLLVICKHYFNHFS